MLFPNANTSPPISPLIDILLPKAKTLPSTMLLTVISVSNLYRSDSINSYVGSVLTVSVAVISFSEISVVTASFDVSKDVVTTSDAKHNVENNIKKMIESKIILLLKKLFKINPPIKLKLPI